MEYDVPSVFYWVMAIYFLLVIGIAYYLRKMTDFADFALAGRTITTPVFIGTMMASWIGAGSVMGLGGMGYDFGISAWWWVGGAFIIWSPILLAWLGAKRIRRTGLVTISDILGARFDGRSRILSLILLLFYTLTQMTLQVISGGVILNVLMGLDMWVGMTLTALVAVGYTTMAGLKGVVWTDVLQFCILAPGFLLILPFVMGAVGGWGNMATSLSSTHTNFFGVGANQILVWLFAVGPGVTLATYTWTRILAAKDEATARKGMIGSLLVGIPWYCIPVILGMVAAVKFPGLEDSQQAIPMIITQMLHPVAGALLLTAFLAVLMSSSDSILIYGSTTFTRDLYQAYMNPKASEKQLVYIGRLVTALMGLFALGWALWMPVIMPIWTLGYAVLSGALFAPVWLGMLSRWATPDASFWSMLICAAIYSVGHFTKPWGLDPIFYVLPLSIILMYILSQYTPKTPREKMEKFLSGEAAGD